MRSPVYVRRDSDSSLPIRRDSREDVDDELERAGVRDKSLILLLALIAILTISSLFLLALNVMLIRTLEMGHRGMRLLKLYEAKNAKSGQMEKVVHFSGSSIQMDEIIAASGKVIGQENTDLDITASRVLLRGEPDSSHFFLQDSGCVLEQVDDFKVISSKTGRTVFSARHPMVTLDKRLNTISGSTIVTNKVRSPVGEKLSVRVENVSLRGKQSITAQAALINVAGGKINFNTTSSGSIVLSGASGIFLGGDTSTRLDVSESPDLNASIDGFRLCMCAHPPGKLFIVSGNKQCYASTHTCQ